MEAFAHNSAFERGQTMPPTDPNDSYYWANPSPAEPADNPGGTQSDAEMGPDIVNAADVSGWAASLPTAEQPHSAVPVLETADRAPGPPAEAPSRHRAADVLERHETTDIDVTSRNVTPGSDGSRLPSRFTADLMRAILDATRAACMAVVEQTRTDADGIVDSIRQTAGDDETDIERRAALDLASIEEWTRAAQSRITEEGERRSTSRQESMAREIESSRERAERSVATTRARVVEFEVQVRAFVEELAEAPDPANLVARAQQIPAPPSLDAGLSGQVGVGELAGEIPAPWDTASESTGAPAEEMQREERDEDASPLERGIEGGQWGVLEAILGPQIRPGDAGILGLPIREEPVSLPPREAPGGPTEALDKPEPAPWDPGWGEVRMPAGEHVPVARTLAEDAAAAAEAAAAREAAAVEREPDDATAEAGWRPQTGVLAEPSSADAAPAAWGVGNEPRPVERAGSKWDLDSSAQAPASAAAWPRPEVPVWPSAEPPAWPSTEVPAWPRAEVPAWPSAEPPAVETWSPPTEPRPWTSGSPGSEPVAAEAVPAEPISAELAPSEPVLAEPRAVTAVAVGGLSSIGAVTAFRRRLEETVGVRDLSVRASADGRFVFEISHKAGVDLGAAIESFEEFGARVLGADEGELTVYAREPDATT
jgi:hypothetical protein